RKMPFLFFYILATFWLSGVMSITMEQTQLSITKSVTRTAKLSCRFQGSSYIHWYRLRPNEALQRILYYESEAKSEYDAGFSNMKFRAEKNNDECFLYIHSLEMSDTAMYYCAGWDYHSDLLAQATCTKTLSLYIIYTE
uniref:Ig-like domain-containing protein n=1 Tax=Latimeria chalumnae TaxID=7897 RepID=H2ZV70_LATCH